MKFCSEICHTTRAKQNRSWKPKFASANFAMFIGAKSLLAIGGEHLNYFFSLID